MRAGALVSTNLQNVSSDLGSLSQSNMSVCGNCGTYLTSQFHQCYPQVRYVHVYGGYMSDKGTQAIKLLRCLKEKGVVKIDTASDLLDALDLIIKEL